MYCLKAGVVPTDFIYSPTGTDTPPFTLLKFDLCSFESSIPYHWYNPEALSSYPS